MEGAHREVTREAPAEKPRCVLVVGLGRTGHAVTRHFLGRGIPTRVTDHAAGELPEDLRAAQWVAPASSEEMLAGVDLVVPSPGVPAADPLLQSAVARGIPVRAEIEIAAAQLRAPMIAVTGTNGKSTTTELVAHLLGGPAGRVFAGGNLGTPLIEALEGRPSSAVVEVSSFQLEWVDAFRPRVGILLNVTEDHLDRHGDVETYAAVKARLFARQTVDDTALLNRDDPRVARLVPELRSHVATFGRGPHDGDGARVDGDEIRVRLRGRRAHFSLARSPLEGAHNRENMMAAILAAMAFEATDAAIETALATFAPLPHRMQLVAERGGVRFIDDSKATNVGALLRSLEGLPDGRVLLVAGGLDKGGDFDAAHDLLAAKVRGVALYGVACAAIAPSWEKVVAVTRHDRFADAVGAAAAAAQSGDVVLLSPACASFDQFEGYAERGNAFAALVGRL